MQVANSADTMIIHCTDVTILAYLTYSAGPNLTEITFYRKKMHIIQIDRKISFT
jgi:hypothetical protein